MAEAHQLHCKSDRRSPPRRVLSRCPRIDRSPRSLKAAAEALGRANNNNVGSAAVPVKIVLTKKQLQQLVAALNQEPAAVVGSMPANVELLLDVLRRRQQANRTEVVQPRCGGWLPVLQSIPEEVVQD